MKDRSLYCFGIAIPEGYVVFIYVKKTDAHGVIVHWQPNTRNLSHKTVWRRCRLHVIKNAITYGCLRLDSYRIDTGFFEKIKPQLWSKIRDFERDGLMYYLQIDGQLEGFETINTRDLIDKIVTAAKKHLRVRVLYLKKSTGKIVRRSIAAYSFEDGYLNVTDTIHGNTQIRTFDTANIKSAVPLKSKFKPEWKIEL
ncbi:MAG: hypothetical protein FVQ80_11635 [Planctomycetes bacterium]|nr:hypothetical protein [Planctomycetota bacterium]